MGTEWKKALHGATKRPGIAAFINGSGVFVCTDPKPSLVMEGPDKGQKTPFDGWFDWTVSGHLSGCSPTVEVAKKASTFWANRLQGGGSDSKYRTRIKWFTEGVQLVEADNGTHQG